MDRLLEATDPAGKATVNQCDEAANALSIADREGKGRRITNDVLNRPTEIASLRYDFMPETFRYDAQNRLTAKTEQSRWVKKCWTSGMQRGEELRDERAQGAHSILPYRSLSRART